MNQFNQAFSKQPELIKSNRIFEKTSNTFFHAQLTTSLQEKQEAHLHKLIKYKINGFNKKIKLKTKTYPLYKFSVYDKTKRVV